MWLDGGQAIHAAKPMLPRTLYNVLSPALCMRITAYVYVYNSDNILSMHTPCQCHLYTGWQELCLCQGSHHSDWNLLAGAAAANGQRSRRQGHLWLWRHSLRHCTHKRGVPLRPFSRYYLRVLCKQFPTEFYAQLQLVKCKKAQKLS